MPASTNPNDPLGLLAGPVAQAAQATVGQQPPEPGNYDQIPLKNQNLYPWTDLQASGGLDRLPVFPDDVLPTLSLPWALGTGGPRVNQCDPDGSLWVSVKHGGGSGGGGSPAQYGTGGNNTVSLKFGANAGGAHIDSAQPLSVIYGIVGGISLDPDPGSSFPGDCSYEITCELVGNGGFDLVNGTLGFYASAPAAGTPIFQPISVLLPTPIDVAKTWGSAGIIRLFFSGETADFWITCSLLGV